MDDFDFDIEDIGGAFDMGGFGGIDLGGIGDLAGAFDLSGFEGIDLGGLGDLAGAFDLGGFEGINFSDFGGLAGAFDVGGFEGVDFSDLGGTVGAFDLGGFEGIDFRDLGGDTGAFDVSGLGDVVLDRDFSGVFGGDVESQLEGFYGETPSAVYIPEVDTTYRISDKPGASFEPIAGKYSSGLSYDPGEGYGTGQLPGTTPEEDVRQFFGDVSGQTTIPEWARSGVESGVIQPNYDGTYTQNFDDGSAQTLDYKGNVVETKNTEGLTYNKEGIITSGPRTGEAVKRSDIIDFMASSKISGGAGGGSGGKGKEGETGKTGKDGKTDDKSSDLAKTIQDLFGGKQNIGTLAALLGGLMGLLGKTGQGKPVGYTGGIPKYTATRGGPGKGVTYTRAAEGGLMGLSAGGAARPARYLRGGTDGMADKIQTNIDGKQPARLSHGEFVIPADVVSHLGNGNSDAGADVLYEMMEKVRKARTGNPKQGKQINPRKYTPA